MNVMKNLGRLSAVAVLIAGSCGVAQAGQATHISTATADLVVNAVEKASISIIPETGLQAGEFEEGKVLATANVTATSGTIAYRWTPHLSSQSLQNDETVILHNKSNDALVLYARLESSTPAIKQDATDGHWMVTKKGTLQDTLTVKTARRGLVAEGNYPVSLDAAIWTE